MFTGLVEAQGVLSAKNNRNGDMRIKVTSRSLDFGDVALGDSIATNGVCLTVTKLEADAYWADVSNETLKLSSFAELPIGAPLNLEKAMLPTTRFGGHMVSGHIDGVAQVVSVKRDARSIVIKIKPPAEVARYIVHKGSVCIDGVSLTVNAVESDGFLLNIVPHTAEQTLVAQYRAGTKVNIEVDLVARYIEQLLNREEPEAKSGVSMDMLARSGFLKR